jgi:hypothetical protein
MHRCDESSKMAQSRTVSQSVVLRRACAVFKIAIFVVSLVPLIGLLADRDTLEINNDGETDDS